MVNVLVTGAQGFVGKNICAAVRLLPEVTLYPYDIENTPEELDAALSIADVIIHLAGVNRSQTVEEFSAGNVEFTGQICSRLELLGRTPQIIFSSSIQAEKDNPYGKSKRAAEEKLELFSDTGASVVIYRLKNLFGKWCRPDYNSVTATFCYNISHNLPIQISDPTIEIELTYIDDVVEAFISEINAPGSPGFHFADPLPSRRISLGALAALIQGFHNQRETLLLDDYSDPFVRSLYATYLSYLDTDQFGYNLHSKADERGSLAELLKSPHAGQIFVSRTKPGVTRGNHYHHTKTEKFIVVQGKAVIRFRRLGSDEVIEYPVLGEDYRVVDIPPGYTHSIENVGVDEMVTLFWASEVFNPEQPDTYFETVLPVKKASC